MITRFEATLALNPDKLVYQDGEPNKIYVDNVLVTDFTEIDKKVEELNLQEPMRLLRQERNRRLAETDYLALKDVFMTTDEELYRQQLRDITKGAKPKLDDHGNLTNITWPVRPK